MTPTDARKRIMDLTSEVVANPARAVELAAEMGALGSIIQASPAPGGDYGPTIPQSMCVAHDQVCKSHQVCKAHPKKLS